MNAFKLHRIIEYIKLFDFTFDIWDFNEDIRNVLLEYNIVDEFSDGELEQLKKELMPMAERYQEGEVMFRFSQQDNACVV